MTSMSLEPPCFDLLQTLKIAATPIADTDELLTSSRRAFQILEPWCQARATSDIPAVRDVISRVKTQAGVYFQTIDMSIKTSENGVNFAAEAVNLCEFLGREEPTEHLIMFIQDLQHIARDAHGSAKATLNSFKSVRLGLLEITNIIPWIVKQVIEDIQFAKMSRRMNQRIEAGARLVKDLASEAATFSGPATAGILTTVAIPHLAFILPVLLPLIALIAGKVEERSCNQVELRRQQELSCNEALLQLERVSNDMAEILQHVNMFASWWSNIETQLLNIKANVERFGASKLDPYMVEMIQKRWDKIANQYRAYISEISKLHDFYPTISSPDNTLNVPVLQVLSVPRLNCPQRKLATIMYSLAEHVDNCQIAFHNVRIACTSVKSVWHSVDLRVQLNEIKIQLKAEWETLLWLLKQMLLFDDGIPVMNEGKYTMITVDVIMNRSHSLIDLHTRSRDVFLSHKEILSKQLLYKLSSRKARKQKNLYLTAKKITDPSSGDESDRGSNSNFVERNLASLHPDGRGALSSLEVAIEDIGLSFGELSNFLTAVLRHSDPDIPTESSLVGDNSAQPGSSRPFDRSVLHAAITSLSISSENLTIDEPEPPNPERFHFRQLVGMKF